MKSMKSYIEFDKTKKRYFIDYYLEDLEFIIKTPLDNIKEKEKEIIVEPFELSNSIYIASLSESRIY